MADNVAITAGAGTTIATDDVGGVQYQRVKVAQGADGSATDVSSAAPLQVTGANGSFPVTDNSGSLTVDAPVGTPVFVRLSDGSSAIATLPVSLATNTPVGTVAHDAADSGNPIKIGARAEASAATATMVADNDRSQLYTDLDGLLLVRNSRPLGDVVSERVSDTGGTSTAFTNFGATASTRNVVTGYSVFNASATAGYIDFRDGTAGSVLWTVPLPAGGGANFAIPDGIFRTTANTALAYDVSAALTTVYISVTGFKSKV